MAFGDTKAPASTLTGVFSFCSPSRGPTSTMRTCSLTMVSRVQILGTEGLDLGEFDAFLHDIADLAFYQFQHARARRAEGLLHFHDLESQDRCALLQPGPLLGQQGNYRARQRRYDLVCAV